MKVKQLIKLLNEGLIYFGNTEVIIETYKGVYKSIESITENNSNVLIKAGDNTLE